jgi:hypothetical protein
MNKKTIINYLENEVNWREKSLESMDRRHKIPKRIKKEIKELKSMIKFLTE